MSAPGVRPVSLVTLRNEMREWAEGWGSHSIASMGVGDEHLLPAVARSALSLAEMFHVSSDMTDLARVAGESLPDFVLQRGDLPSDCGLLIYESGAGEFTEPRATFAEGRVVTKERAAVQRGIVWISTGVKVGMFFLRDRADTEVTRPGWKMPPLMPYGYAELVYGQAGIDQNFDAFSLSEHGRTFLAASLLMSQPGIGVSKPYEFDKLDRARLKRQRLKTAPIRVITLRRPAGEPGVEGSGRSYMHRWLVRGHWRKQACGPGRVERKPIWIAPHIKGPEGAPLLAGEKVYAWVR